MARGLNFDTLPFELLISEANRAYQSDSSYAVAMARQAINILNKRAAYKARKQASVVLVAASAVLDT